MNDFDLGLDEEIQEDSSSLEENTQNNTQNNVQESTQSVMPPKEAEDEIYQVSKSQWENMQESINTIQKERYYSDTISSLKKEFSDFNESEVITKLKEIHAKDPNLAEQYNTPIGFKALWLEISKNKAVNDSVNSGSSKVSGDDFSSYLENAMKSDENALKKALNLSI